jgi:hypothetical protein
MQDDTCPGGVERLGDGGANTPPGSRDQGNLAFDLGGW